MDSCIPPTSQPKPMHRLLLNFALFAMMAAGHASEPNYRVRLEGESESRAAAERSHAELVSQMPNIADLDKPLKTLSSPFPYYPQQLRDAHISGRVRVLFWVGEDGRVSDPTVLGAPPPALAALSVEAILRWRFEVPLKKGQPTRTRAAQDFIFQVG